MKAFSPTSMNHGLLSRAALKVMVSVKVKVEVRPGLGLWILVSVMSLVRKQVPLSSFQSTGTTTDHDK